MRQLISAAIKMRKITFFIVVLIMIFGLYSYFIIPKQEFPDLNAPAAMIYTVYPGASSEDVEKLVTRRIEEKVVEIDGYSYCNSYSNDDISIVIVRLDYGTDINKAWNQLRQKMDDLQAELPDGCLDIQVNTNLVDTTGIILSITGENYTYDELVNYAEVLKKELRKVNGVSRFEIVGEQEKEVGIEVEAEKLNFYKISLDDIVNIVKLQNTELPSGKIEYENSKINVKISNIFSSLDDIKNLIIGVSDKNGSIVRLGDIADVYIKAKDSNVRIKHNGKNTILLTGYFKENENIVLVGKKVEKQITEIIKDFPEDISVNQVLFQPEEVSKSINNFILNLIEGMLFVIIVVFMGMGLRNAIVVSTAIPVSIISTFIAMHVLGIKIHQISITGLIIALGMLVDNAIVISDSIQNKIDNGDEKFKACIEGVKEVAIPILTSTLTTIGAFLPLLLLDSIAGEYISSLPEIVMLSLFSSYLVALVVTPTMAYTFFKKDRVKDRMIRYKEFFNSILYRGMKKKKVTILFTIFVLVMTVFIFKQINLQFFPKSDKNIIYIDIKTERNLSISNTEVFTAKVIDILEKQPEIVSHTEVIGGGLPKFYDSIPITVSSPDIAQIMVRLNLKESDRFKNNSQIVDYLQEIFDSELTGGTATVKQLELGEPIGAPIRIRLTGKNIERLGQVSKEIRDILQDLEGTVNVKDDYSDKIYEFEIAVDYDRAYLYGITKYDIQKEVSAALRGRKASVFRKRGNEYDIIVKSNIKAKEDLENLAIKSSFSDKKVLLKEIADIKLKSEIPTINKYDLDFAVMVTSDVKPGFNSIDIQKELITRLKDINLEGVEVAFDGEREKIKENFGSVGNSAIFAILIIYAILMLQFKSFRQPLVILLTIPLSAVGSILGLYLFKQPLSFTALLGMVSLMGIVVNNAIVLIDYINSARKRGESIENACLKAANRRFRPIILSTATTIIGLTPLVFSGSNLFRPMAISLMFGLLVSTLLTLVIIPVVYSIVEIEV
ncbi:efflux RND transporter permease subunit [Caloranaerobacter ferrireducens]|uniref:efflux RND transporter permease subunit n=1 Tax=Caloranaerobacter ferrireducens TaxID=1323370 RepID=UPI00084DA5E5|nr:efflux RND transporter permease subunit [Caloranaerobacter ferrireducens]